jgi:hypothetical protein
MSVPAVKWIVEFPNGHREEFETRPLTIAADALLIRCEYWPRAAAEAESTRVRQEANSFMDELRQVRAALGDWDQQGVPAAACIRRMESYYLEQRDDQEDLRAALGDWDRPGQSAADCVREMESYYLELGDEAEAELRQVQHRLAVLQAFQNTWAALRPRFPTLAE